MAIDLRVSRAVTRIHALERAVHDNGDWTVELAGLIVPAQRTLSEDGVRFTAVFPSRVSGCPILQCDGDTVWMMQHVAASEKSFELAFELTLPLGIAA